jgi:acyl carrier protein
MDRDEAFKKFTETTVKVLGVEPSQVTMEARFNEDLDADSLDLVELIMALEDEFSVSVPESELEGVDTVGKAFELVYGKLS